MSRIVLDAREFTTTTGRYMNRLIQYLQEIDHKNEYIILLQPKDAENWKPNAQNFRVVTTPFKEFSFGEQIGFAKQIRDLRPDLVHFGMSQQPIFYHGKVVTSILDLTTTRFKNPSKNSIVFWVKQQIYKIVVLVAAKKSKHVITISDYVKKDLSAYAHIPESKITTTHLAADAIIDDPEPVASLVGKKFIMYVGRPQPHKNLGRLIESFAELRKSHPDLLLALVGKHDTIYSMHVESAKQLGVQHEVIFTGFVNEGQLKWLYEHTACYVFPSLSEGFGLPALEAMVHGAPVASSNATCLPEIYGDAAHYFDPTSINAITTAVADILDNTALRTKLIKLGTHQAAKYGWKNTAKRTLDVYADVLK